MLLPSFFCSLISLITSGPRPRSLALSSQLVPWDGAGAEQSLLAQGPHTPLRTALCLPALVHPEGGRGREQVFFPAAGLLA